MFSYLFHTTAYLAKGGIIMIPIVLCSFLALAVFIERLLTLKRSKIIPRDFFNDVSELILKNKIEEADKLCDENESSLARIIAVGIRYHEEPIEVVKENITEAGRREVAKMDRHTPIIGTVANITPLLGLLGTVSGMIKAFNVISTVGVGDPSVLAGGISEALITTAAGLTVAIPSFVGYKYILGLADNYVMEMEEYSTHIVEILKRNTITSKSKDKTPVGAKKSKLKAAK